MAPIDSKNRFTNTLPTEMNPEGSSMWKALGKMIRGIPNKKPTRPIDNLPVDRSEIEGLASDFFIFLGHSSLYLQLDGIRIMVDPVFSKTASPLPFAGPRAFTYTNTLSLNLFPDPDIVLISHDHFDHLDKSAVRTLKDRAQVYICPLNVGRLLSKWGIEKSKIIELDWGQSIHYKNRVRITSQSARHFSGRGLFNRMKTLWCSYVINSENKNIFFSGDSGYGPHFKEIGEQYGSFDHSFIECGQYNENWPLIHMVPEDTVQAAIDLKTNNFTPIHWGKFALSLHPWDEPPKRAQVEAQQKKQEISIPIFGAINHFYPNT